MKTEYKLNPLVMADFEIREGTFDEGIVKEVWQELYYTPENTIFTIKEGDVVVDIGAHIGTFSVLAARLGASKVYSFEPNKANFLLLEKNLYANQVRDRVEANFCAVSGEVSKMYMNDIPHDFSNNTGGFTTSLVEKDNSYEVLSKPINDIMDGISKVDYMKIDCEGGEWDIFRFISDENLAKISKIGMEYHESYEKAHCLSEMLTGFGFKVDYFDTSNTTPLGKLMYSKP